MIVGFDRIYLERNNMDNEQLKRIADAVEKRTNYRTGEVTELRGIRNALEEILHLVKKDMQKYEKKD